MPMNQVTSAEIFTVRVYKRLEGQEWANSYEFAALEDSNAPETMFGNLRTFVIGLERAIHLTDVWFDRLVISTYQPDSRPYDPTRFQTFPIGLSGQRTRSGDALSLAICLFVRREPQFGRPGKLLYRGVLQEGDVAGYRSGLLTQAQTSLQAAVNTAFSQIPSSWQMVLARGAPTPQDVRRVISLNLSPFTTIKKLDNRYFDRAPRGGL